MLSEELQKLIEASLTDGVLTKRKSKIIKNYGETALDDCMSEYVGIIVYLNGDSIQ